MLKHGPCPRPGGRGITCTVRVQPIPLLETAGLARRNRGQKSQTASSMTPITRYQLSAAAGHPVYLRVAAGIQEQSPNERRQDVLCYTTPELKEDLEVTGQLKLHLFAASSARDTDFVAKLVDVYPDGRAYNVTTDGIIRARYRKSLFQPDADHAGRSH